MPTNSSSSRSRSGGATDPEFRRLALAPGLLGTIALLIGFAIIESETFVAVRYAAAILALIMVVFALQGRAWWWVPPLGALAVIWNPVWVIPVEQPWWTGAQYLGVLVFVLAGIFIKVRRAAAHAAS
jgi:hypothetical protein